MAAVGSPYISVDIKLGKAVVGMIQAPNWQTKDNLWRIQFAVEKTAEMADNNPNCSWKNITLSKGFEDAEQAKEFILKNSDAIQQKYTLHDLGD